MSYSCPICNKAGLPDYRAAATTCPQCNSNLEPFFLLSRVSSKPKRFGQYILMAGVLLMGIGFSILYFSSIAEKKKIIESNSAYSQRLMDSIQTLHSSTQPKAEVIKEEKKPEKEAVIEYKIKKNDNLSSIAKLFYDDWTLYKLIEEDNNLKQPYIIKPGQTLLIKVKTK